MLNPEELDRVRGVLYLSGLRGDDIDDAAQEVQLRVLERAPAGLRNRAAWACAVAANLARDWLRRRGRWQAAEDVLRRKPVPLTSDPDLALANAVAVGLRRLDSDLRAVLVLRFYADLPVRDIAQMLDVLEGTVKSRLHRATSAMRELLPRETVL
ncbi:RNA polymerase sigma factor [Micromonospora sp. NBC_01412]|uniref:RNA polymerase sigma factor n=1 Tax=Micromonospora sp. NBC_01412 TaxID=2903590 RepID=UPI003243A41F